MNARLRRYVGSRSSSWLSVASNGLLVAFLLVAVAATAVRVLLDSVLLVWAITALIVPIWLLLRAVLDEIIRRKADEGGVQNPADRP